MGRVLRFGLYFLGAVFLLIQFVSADRPPSSPRPNTDLLGSGQVPGVIASMLKTSCYDCHSVETIYPWYSYVAPVSWLVAEDVRHGRDELNLSNWQELTTRRKVRYLDDIKEVIQEGDMPLPKYLRMHADAKLTDEQRRQIVQWAAAFQQQIMNEPEPDDEDDDEEDEIDEEN